MIAARTIATDFLRNGWPTSPEYASHQSAIDDDPKIAAEFSPDNLKAAKH